MEQKKYNHLWLPIASCFLICIYWAVKRLEYKLGQIEYTIRNINY